MSVYDLTGQEVSETYYRIVQVISGSLYDGLGNEIALNVSGTVDYNNILNIPNGILSSSAQISNDISGAFNSISSSFSINKLNRIGDSVYSSSNQLPPNLISGSSQIANEISGAFTLISSSLESAKLNRIGDNVYSSSNQLPTGLISSSNGFISSSAQIATDISGAFNLISSSLAANKLDKIGSNVYSSSLQLPLGIISSSAQLPGGIISSSNGFISSSGQIANEISGAFNLVSASLALDKLNRIGSNVYSSSAQLPSGIISSSTQLPTGLISSSNGFISSSGQIASDISGSIGNFSSSIATQLNTINSKLIDSFGIVIQGGASDIVTGSKNIYRAKQSGQLTAMQMDSYAYGTNLPISGTIGIHVTRNGITMGTASMSSTASFFDSTLTGWNKTITIFDKIEYSVLNNSSIKNITLTLYTIN